MLDAVKDLSAKYYQLGVRLGLQSSKLDDIRSEHVSDVKQALIEILKLWLNLDYPYRLYGSPTWQRLVESVNPINHRIARSIASQHQKGKFYIYILSYTLSNVAMLCIRLFHLISIHPPLRNNC